MSPILQTKTPLLIQPPDKDALVAEFVGKSCNSLRTPAFIVDRAVFAKNCRKIHENAREWGATFRGHLKTHKASVEG
jgi:D-serine deaminase-like pyridoxal phosphate-dependent protein